MRHTLFSSIVVLSCVVAGALGGGVDGDGDGGGDGDGAGSSGVSGPGPRERTMVGPVADLVVGNKIISPDGFNRSAVLAGASSDLLMFPGPVIRANKGDTFRLNVIDQLVDTSMLVSTSIHWHGLFQKRSSWADGPVGVTQCPIAPQHAFLYEFESGDQAGTFWYHSHFSTQYCDGLRGPLIVYDDDDPHQDLYDIDDESTIITLADWYHAVSPLAIREPVPTFDSTLINGRGRYPGGPATPLAVVHVVQGKRYRFRLVSISCDPNFKFSIDGHSLTIIEADSENTQPLTVDSIQIFAGQRYSFILSATNAIANYWIRALPNVGTVGFSGGINSAVLRYRGAPASEPSVSPSAPPPPSVSPFVEADLHPLENPEAPGVPGQGNADVSINLGIVLNITQRRFEVNGVSYRPASVPVLLQILSGARRAEELMPLGSVYALPSNKVVEISMPGGSLGSPHPIHLHGHSFSVVRSANSSVYNYANPLRRDVVNIGSAKTDNVTIRFRTDNPGPWILHCHIDWHLELGLSVILAESTSSIARTANPPPEWDDLCPIYDALPAQTFN